MRAFFAGSVAAAGLLLGASAAQADCADVLGCVCNVRDVVVVATVLEVHSDGFMSVELERIYESAPGAAERFTPGDVVEALPFMQVEQGARAYLTAAGPGETELVQFNQAEEDGTVICSGAVFDEEEFIATATAADCHDLATAKGIESNCVDESHGCALTGPTPARTPIGPWLIALAAALGLGRGRRRARR